MSEIYVDNLTDHEKKALDIAKHHLKTSFSMTKSIGFIRFSDKPK